MATEKEVNEVIAEWRDRLINAYSPSKAMTAEDYIKSMRDEVFKIHGEMTMHLVLSGYETSIWNDNESSAAPK